MADRDSARTMKPTEELLEPRIGPVRAGAFRSRAAILVVLGLGVLAPPAAGQTPFTMTMDMDMDMDLGAVKPASAQMPNPAKAAEKLFQCDDAPGSCMEDVFDAVAPAVAPPPAPSEPSTSQPQPPPSPPALTSPPSPAFSPKIQPPPH